jgi:hypothetical protein
MFPRRDSCSSSIIFFRSCFRCDRVIAGGGKTSVQIRFAAATTPITHSDQRDTVRIFMPTD